MDRIKDFIAASVAVLAVLVVCFAPMLLPSEEPIVEYLKSDGEWKTTAQPSFQEKAHTFYTDNTELFSDKKLWNIAFYKKSGRIYVRYDTFATVKEMKDREVSISPKLKSATNLFLGEDSEIELVEMFADGGPSFTYHIIKKK